jgi:hypothetical protein
VRKSQPVIFSDTNATISRVVSLRVSINEWLDSARLGLSKSVNVQRSQRLGRASSIVKQNRVHGIFTRSEHYLFSIRRGAFNESLNFSRPRNAAVLRSAGPPDTATFLHPELE